MQCFSSIACASKVVAGGCLVVLLGLLLGAKSPDNIDGLKLWLKADAGVYEDTDNPVDGTGDLVKQWNDQSGANNHVTQTGDVDNRPIYNVENGVPSVRIDYWRTDSVTGTDRVLYLPGAFKTSSVSLTGVAVLEMNSLNRQSRILTLGTLDQAVENTPDNIQLLVQNGVLQVWDGAVRRKTSLYVPSSKCVVVWRSNGSNMIVYLNTVSASAVFPATPPKFYTGGFISSIGAGWFSIHELAWYDRDIGENAARDLLDGLVAKYSIAVAPVKRIIIVGDSLSEGIGATLNRPFWRRLSDQDYFVAHVLSGLTLRPAAAAAGAEVDPWFSVSTLEEWLFCKLGTNDINSLRTGAVVYSDLKAYCEARKAAGADKVVVWTVNIKSSNTAIEGARNEFNTEVRADFDRTAAGATGSPYVFRALPGTTYADYLVDFADHTDIGGESGVSTTYWVENDLTVPWTHLHLTDAGYELEAGMIRAGLGGLGVASALEDAKITVDTEASDIRNVTVQLLDRNGVPSVGRFQVTLALYEDAAGTKYATLLGSTGLDARTSSDAVVTIETKKVFVATSENDGHIDLKWTDNSVPPHAVYLGVILPNGRVVVGPEIKNINP